jgi:hypothetical protein
MTNPESIMACPKYTQKWLLTSGMQKDLTIYHSYETLRIS